MVNIVPILKNKKEFLELLLLADEQESMIDLYLERGEMYALYDGDLKAACVITDEGNGVYEIKNIATYPHYQRKGYGKRLMKYASHNKHIYKVDVNEQNEQALQFYLYLGFEVASRDATDSTGNPFPILHLQIQI